MMFPGSNLPLSKEKLMAIGALDQSITIRDQEMMETISNYSISHGDIPATKINIDTKKYDCISQICNFQERVPPTVGRLVGTPLNSTHRHHHPD